MKISPQFLHEIREDALLIITLSSTSRFTTMSISINFFNCSACGIVRGNPSRMNPFSQSLLEILFFSISITTSSGTSSPDSMYFFAFSPISVSFFMFSLNRYPVDMCGIFLIGAIREAAVPFPAFGAPKNIFLIEFSLNKIVYKICGAYLNDVFNVLIRMFDKL